jgi:hypothetical protein
VINVIADVRQASFYLMRISKALKDKATVRALNDTLRQARSEAIREIKREGYNLPTATIRQKLKEDKAKKNKKTAILSAIDKPVNIIKYGAKQKGFGGIFRDDAGKLRWKGKGQGISVKIKTQRKTIKSGFIANNKAYIRESRTSANTGLFVPNKGDYNYKGGFSIKAERIKQLTGPGVDAMFNNEAIKKAMEKKTIEAFPKRLEFHLIKLIK